MPEVLEAAQRAGAHATVIGLPCGYATPLTGGWQLSMGQRHRIALARALYGRPEAAGAGRVGRLTGPAGRGGDRALLRRLKAEGVAVVFTTHRPSLLASADRVLAIRQGQLVPAGEERPRLSGPAPKLPRSRRPAMVTHERPRLTPRRPAAARPRRDAGPRRHAGAADHRQPDGLPRLPAGDEASQRRRDGYAEQRDGDRLRRAVQPGRRPVRLVRAPPHRLLGALAERLGVSLRAEALQAAVRNAVRTDMAQGATVLREIAKVQALFASRAALLFLELIGAVVAILMMFALDTTLGFIGLGSAAVVAALGVAMHVATRDRLRDSAPGDGRDRDRAERPALPSGPGARPRPGAGHPVPLAASLWRRAGGGGGDASPHRGAARDRDAGLRPAADGRLPLCGHAAVRRLGHRRHAHQRLFPDVERAASLLPA